MRGTAASVASVVGHWVSKVALAAVARSGLLREGDGAGVWPPNVDETHCQRSRSARQRVALVQLVNGRLARRPPHKLHMSPPGNTWLCLGERQRLNVAETAQQRTQFIGPAFSRDLVN